MYLDYSKRRIQELSGQDGEDVQACTEEEVAALEEKLGGRLPGVYREYLLCCGKGGEGAQCGLDFVGYEEQMTSDLRTEYQEFLKEEGVDPGVLGSQAVILEFNYDGYFGFLRGSEGEDPPVYLYNPNDRAVGCCCERFSDYVALRVENGLGPGGWEYLKNAADLDHLPHGVETICGLLFWGGLDFGAVPDRVFELKELRYLNLVGKGLLELSPRIGELAFLKRLDLARNSLASLPMAMAELDELEELDLADNQLSTVFGVIRKLSGLRRCWLAGNPLAEEEISQLRRELPHVELITAPATSL